MSEPIVSLAGPYAVANFVDPPFQVLYILQGCCEIQTRTCIGVQNVVAYLRSIVKSDPPLSQLFVFCGNPVPIVRGPTGTLYLRMTNGQMLSLYDDEKEMQSVENGKLQPPVMMPEEYGKPAAPSEDEIVDEVLDVVDGDDTPPA